MKEEYKKHLKEFIKEYKKLVSKFGLKISREEIGYYEILDYDGDYFDLEMFKELENHYNGDYLKNGN